MVVGLDTVLLLISKNRIIYSVLDRKKSVDDDHKKYFEAVSGLNLISASNELDSNTQIEKMLEIGCRYLNSSLGQVSCVDLDLHSKTVTKTVYSDSYNEHKEKMFSDKMLFIDDENLFMNNDVTAPIVTNRDFYGTVNFRCFAKDKRLFSQVDKSLVILIGSNIGVLLARDLATKVMEEKIEAELAKKAKNIYIRDLSHELRTPLTAIMGYSDLVSIDADAFGHKNISSDISKIKKASSHLLTLVNDILDVSKIDSGNIKVANESFSAELALKEAAESVEVLMFKNNNKLKVSCLTNLGIISSDEIKFRQILINLLGNASKFTQNGDISLEANRESNFNGEWISIKVIDSGVGMTKDESQSLFRQYAQLDSGLEINQSGTGLGLYISHKYCNLMGGELTVESQPGKGSVFTVRLPVLPVQTNQFGNKMLVSAM